MALRFVDTERYNEDWYNDLSGEYQSLWNYICDKCDNAGVWKPNKSGFETLTKFSVNLGLFLKKVNGEKERLIVLGNGRWFIPGFIKFQWFNKCEYFDLNLNNRLHKSLYNIIIQNNIPLEKVRGLKEVLETSKDKDTSKSTKGKGLLGGNQNMPKNQSEPVSSAEVPPFYGGIVPTKTPTQQEVREFFVRSGGTMAQADRFFNHYEGLSWRKGNSPIYNWAAFANNWIAGDNSKSEPTQQQGSFTKKI